MHTMTEREERDRDRGENREREGDRHTDRQTNRQTEIESRETRPFDEAPALLVWCSI